MLGAERRRAGAEGATVSGRALGIAAVAVSAAAYWAFGLAQRVCGQTRRVHVVLPATAGSLGDQAVLSGLAEMARSIGLDAPIQVTLRDWIPHDCPEARGSVRISIEGDAVPAGLSIARMLRDCSQLIILGTDIIEGNYSGSHIRNLVKLSNIAARLGVPVHICGFSFSSSPNSDAVRWLERLDHRVQFTSRDQASAVRFAKYVGRATDLVADPAFAMAPRLEADQAIEASEWISRRRTAGDAILGVNANAIACRRAPLSVPEVYVSNLSQALARRSVSVLLVPHDLRPDQSDIVALEEVRSHLEGQFPGRCHLVKPPVSAWDAKRLVGECDLIVSGRLHLAIAAISQGCPVIGIEYHDKFRGIFHAAGIESLLMTQGEMLEEGRLCSMVLSALDRLPQICADLAGSRSFVNEGLACLAATLAPR